MFQAGEIIAYDELHAVLDDLQANDCALYLRVDLEDARGESKNLVGLDFHFNSPDYLISLGVG